MYRNARDKGFEDTLDTGMEQRYDLFDLRITYPDPIVPRTLRKSINERIHFNGDVETELNSNEVIQQTRLLIEEEGMGSSCLFLHSYMEPTHERKQ
ncbi:MAG: hypothetical protein CM15mP14_0730 [Rhodospirillaceae bacterium]|nr:MAG: hypothetical protein CM15mP14_0730 [Rhodospirillaceae bacterium]